MQFSSKFFNSTSIQIVQMLLLFCVLYFCFCPHRIIIIYLSPSQIFAENYVTIFYLHSFIRCCGLVHVPVISNIMALRSFIVKPVPNPFRDQGLAYRGFLNFISYTLRSALGKARKMGCSIAMPTYDVQ